jgi:hypothetical protein
MLDTHSKTPTAVEQKRPEHPASFAALMVHVDIERDANKESSSQSPWPTGSRPA